MAIVRPQSTIYAILCGEHQGKRCVIDHRVRESNGVVGVLIADAPNDTALQVEIGWLAQLEIPGWPLENGKRSYDLDEYLRWQKGSGSNMLRTNFAAQPEALVAGDVLATGETVISKPRMGYNSSILVYLDRTGWIEAASRLPFAMKGNVHYRLPFELREGDRLLTSCSVVTAPILKELNWVSISLDHLDTCIEVPSCVPLALAEA